MDSFRMVVPARVVRELRERNIADETIRQTVLKALEELAERPPTRARKTGETANAYFRRMILDRRGGVPPSPDEPFAKGMTRAEYLALSDEEEKALWNQWEREEWDKIDQAEKKKHHARPHASTPRQKRSAKNGKGAREKRARYRAERRRTNRP